jgi:hypothetical protein
MCPASAMKQGALSDLPVKPGRLFVDRYQSIFLAGDDGDCFWVSVGLGDAPREQRARQRVS